MRSGILLLIIVSLVAMTACANREDSASAAQSNVPPVTRTYYIAADEVEWDYAPTGTNLGEGRPFTDEEKKFMEVGPTVIGRKAKKARYQEYTDGTFTALKPRSVEWEHLGLMGPLLRGQVGDTIKVVFKNNVKFPASLHPHGVFYNKDSEGAPYNDGTSGADRADDGVEPGTTYTYTWLIPERAGPTEHEGSSVIWMYHSHVEEVRDVMSGLIGPIIVTRKGMARADGSPTDVDREIVGGFLEFDENNSWYVEQNVKTHIKDPSKVHIIPGPFHALAVMPDTDKFFRETINGFTYGHTPGMTMKTGQHVRWYLMASTDFEIHAPHWHGNVVTVNHMRTDVGSLLPMGMFVADMTPDNPGKWFFHCHTGNHLKMGMQATYVVEGDRPKTTSN